MSNYHGQYPRIRIFSSPHNGHIAEFSNWLAKGLNGHSFLHKPDYISSQARQHFNDLIYGTDEDGFNPHQFEWAMVESLTNTGRGVIATWDIGPCLNRTFQVDAGPLEDAVSRFHLDLTGRVELHFNRVKDQDRYFVVFKYFKDGSEVVKQINLYVKKGRSYRSVWNEGRLANELCYGFSQTLNAHIQRIGAPAEEIEYGYREEKRRQEAESKVVAETLGRLAGE
jgi:hypothetical protein